MSRPKLVPRVLAPVDLACLGGLAGVLLWLWPEEFLVTLLYAVAFAPLALVLLPGWWWRKDDAPPPPAQDLDARRHVWRALSELYLDTELDAQDLERLAHDLAQSHYRVTQLEEILFREIHPVLFANLVGIGGEWVSFDQRALEEKILARDRRRGRIGLIPGRWVVQNDWTELRDKVEELDGPDLELKEQDWPWS